MGTWIMVFSGLERETTVVRKFGLYIHTERAVRLSRLFQRIKRQGVVQTM